MIYINKDSDKILLPKHFSINDEVYTLKISNGITSTVIDNLTNTSLVKDYYEFTWNTELQVGEYTYEIISDNIYECGLLVYGEYRKKEVRTVYTSHNNLQFNGKRN